MNFLQNNTSGMMHNTARTEFENNRDKQINPTASQMTPLTREGFSPSTNSA